MNARRGLATAAALLLTAMIAACGGSGDATRTGDDPFPSTSATVGVSDVSGRPCVEVIGDVTVLEFDHLSAPGWAAIADVSVIGPGDDPRTHIVELVDVEYLSGDDPALVGAGGEVFHEVRHEVDSSWLNLWAASISEGAVEFLRPMLPGQDSPGVADGWIRWDDATLTPVLDCGQVELFERAIEQFADGDAAAQVALSESLLSLPGSDPARAEAFLDSLPPPADEVAWIDQDPRGREYDPELAPADYVESLATAVVTVVLPDAWSGEAAHSICAWTSAGRHGCTLIATTERGATQVIDAYFPADPDGHVEILLSDIASVDPGNDVLLATIEVADLLALEDARATVVPALSGARTPAEVIQQQIEVGPAELLLGDQS